MSKRKISVGMSDSDRVAPLIGGQVRNADVALAFESDPVDDIFWRALHTKTYDLVEMSLAAHCIIASRGDRRFVGLPIFTSRMFRHGSVYVPANSTITSPAELTGKRVGVPEYQMTAAVWVRGIFSEFYGLDLSSVHWFAGGVDRPGRKDRIELFLPKNYHLTRVEEPRTLGAMLVDGELDALISAKMPNAFRESGKVRRLFKDAASEEASYFAATGDFPIMHLCVLRREVYEQDPSVVEAIYGAFDEARKISLARLYDSDALAVMSPFLLYGLEKAHQVLGRDYWPYGVPRNERCLKTFLRYLREQGLLQKEIALRDLFAEKFHPQATLL
jgi:4,5-dihydroxyphthalate decarboxylase